MSTLIVAGTTPRDISADCVETTHSTRMTTRALSLILQREEDRRETNIDAVIVHFMDIA